MARKERQGQIGLRLPPDLARQAHDAAKKRGLTRSTLIRMLLTDYLKHFPPDEPTPKLAAPTWKRSRAKAKR